MVSSSPRSGSSLRSGSKSSYFPFYILSILCFLQPYFLPSVVCTVTNDFLSGFKRDFLQQQQKGQHQQKSFRLTKKNVSFHNDKLLLKMKLRLWEVENPGLNLREAPLLEEEVPKEFQDEFLEDYEGKEGQIGWKAKIENKVNPDNRLEEDDPLVCEKRYELFEEMKMRPQAKYGRRVAVQENVQKADGVPPKTSTDLVGC